MFGKQRGAAPTHRLRGILPSAAIALAVLSVIISPLRAEPKNCPSWRSKIVGGRTVTSGDWPAQAALRLFSDSGPTGPAAVYFCGGSVINDRWVLTAGHCMVNYISTLSGRFPVSEDQWREGQLEVVVGADDLTKVTSDHVFQVEKVVVHDNYRAKINEARALADPNKQEAALDGIAQITGDDIALILLKRSWKGPAARLSLSGERDPQEARVQVRTAGFGATEKDKIRRKLHRFASASERGELFAGSARLRETTIETIATPQCVQRYSGAVVGAGQICAGLEQGGKDSCEGDSGGPLMAEDEDGCPRQIGVVSWGFGCAEEKAYGVYTRISHYAGWIRVHAGVLPGDEPSPASAAAPGGRLTAAQLDAALARLKKLLGPTEGQVRVNVKGGNAVKLGQAVVFNAHSEIKGRLIILDINTEGEVTEIYPNQFVEPSVSRRIEAGEDVDVPGPDYQGFSGFLAQEPLGLGWLLALVVPEDARIDQPDQRNKGFIPFKNPSNYLMGVLDRISAELKKQADVNGGNAGGQGWGYGLTKYYIER
jgi:secreted trypsin-like serine protease